jgi:hypothetical protein
MISIFNGRSRSLGEGATSHVYMQVSVEFRDHLDQFRGAELFVFLAIALHSNEAGWAWPSYEYLAEETGYGRDTVARALSSLCKLDIDGKRILLRVRFRDDLGVLGPNHYLLFPSQQELQQYDGHILPLSERMGIIEPRMGFPDVAKPYLVEPHLAEPDMDNPDDNSSRPLEYIENRLSRWPHPAPRKQSPAGSPTSAIADKASTVCRASW